MREEGIAGWKGHADGTREQPRPCQPQPSVTPPAPPTATVKSAVLVSLGQVHHLSGVFWNRNHCRWKSKGTRVQTERPQALEGTDSPLGPLKVNKNLEH